MAGPAFSENIFQILENIEISPTWKTWKFPGISATDFPCLKEKPENQYKMYTHLGKN